MKYSLFLLSFWCFVACNSTPNREVPFSNQEKAPLLYDSVRAATVGADDYGMKQYVMALLKKGPNRDLSEQEAQKLQRAHLDNIKKLADEGVLVVAGPFISDGDLRGIYIFDVQTVEEAGRLVETDPAIQQGSLLMELIPWYGSAALMEVSKIHKQIAKVSI